jgi:uncharacterized protein YcgI (DUF1989 family)
LQRKSLIGGIRVIIDEPRVEKKLVFDKVIPAKDSLAFEVKKGQYLRIIDIEGKQVGDFIVLNAHNLKEYMCPLNTRTGIIRTQLVDPSPPIIASGGVYFRSGVGTGGVGTGVGTRLLTGHKLLSNIFNPMMTVVADTQVPSGVHDFFQGRCASWIYERRGFGPHKGCFELFVDALKDWGFEQMYDIPPNINIFMNVPVDPTTGLFCIEEPVTRPGDYIEFRAEIDCVCALVACPDNILSKCNGTPPHSAKPLQVQIYKPK